MRDLPSVSTGALARVSARDSAKREEVLGIKEPNDVVPCTAKARGALVGPASHSCSFVYHEPFH